MTNVGFRMTVNLREDPKSHLACTASYVAEGTSGYKHSEALMLRLRHQNCFKGSEVVRFVTNPIADPLMTTFMPTCSVEPSENTSCFGD